MTQFLTNDPAEDVGEAEALFRASDHAAALDILLNLDLPTVPAQILDRALPVMLMAGVVAEGEEFSLKLLETVESQTASGGPDAQNIVKTYRAESTAEPHLRVALATEVLSQLQSSTAPVARHRAIAVLLEAKVDLGQGFDQRLLEQMEELEKGMSLVAPVDSALAQRGLLAYQVDLLDESRTSLNILRRQARLDNEPYMERIFATHLATVDIYAGRTESAYGLLRAFEDDAPMSPAAARASGLIALRSSNETALQAVLLQPTLQGSAAHGALTRYALIGLAAARREQWREAYYQLSNAVKLASSLGLDEPGRRMWVDFALARAAIEIGNPKEAARMAQRLERVSGGSRPLIDGVVARIRGLLASTDNPAESMELLEESIALLSGAGFPEQLVLSLLELGRSLRLADRFDDARQALRRARAITQQTGDSALGILVDRALKSASSDSVLSVLTSHERHIARAVARGVSNRQIAEERSTSVRTVETQLSSIYRKLGIRSRAQLTVSLAVRANGDQEDSR